MIDHPALIEMLMEVNQREAELRGKVRPERPAGGHVLIIAARRLVELVPAAGRGLRGSRPARQPTPHHDTPQLGV